MDDACAWSADRETPIIKEFTNEVQQVFVGKGPDIIKEARTQNVCMQDADLAKETRVTDIGWNLSREEVTDPLINNIPNDKIWALIRRFNKDVSHVKKLSTGPPDVFDLEDVTEAEDFRPDRLALNLQRAYFTIVLGIASVRKHLARLRSWKEERRTLSFLLVYSMAWTFDILAPVVVFAVMVTITSEQVRNFIFPQLPRSIVDTRTGMLKTPEAGQLGSFGTLTGALESSAGEAADREASNFIDNLRHLVLRAVGMHNGNEQGTEPMEGKVPRFVRDAVKAVKHKGSHPGHVTQNEDDGEQKPMEDIIWSNAKPENIWPYIVAVPETIGEIVDSWERVANIISPTPPFSRLSIIRLYLILLPILAVSLLITPYLAWKSTGFLVGFGMFGKPVLTPSFQWLDHHYPRWRDILRPNRNILRGVPTNAQLTLTLLRLGEAHAAPLPPIPSSDSSSPKHVSLTKTNESTLPVTQNELDSIINPMPAKNSKESESQSAPDNQSSGPERGSTLPSVLGAIVKHGVQAKLKFNRLLARFGSIKAQQQVGVFTNSQNLIYSGPGKFRARYEGRPGWVRFEKGQNGPRLVFVAGKAIQADEQENTNSAFLVPVNEICELKRASSTMRKPLEKAAEYSMEKEILESVEIVDEDGKTWILTALPERNELFNRLISIGNQRWVKI